MQKLHSFLIGLTVALLLPNPASSQSVYDQGFNSITDAEMRDHMFFLASDYLGGRYAPSAGYEIASQYVATQFKAAGLKPVVKNEDGSFGYLQGVPFAKTLYNDKLSWKVITPQGEKALTYLEDFRILMANQLTHERCPVVYAGYGISEPDSKWDDFKDLNVEGKVVLILAGAPKKGDKPVLPEAISNKYTGRRGLYAKIFGVLADMHPAAVVIVDLNNALGTAFEEIPSSFSTEKTVYKGSKGGRGGGSFPSMYVAKPEFLDLVMPGMKNNPNANPKNILKNYRPQLLDGMLLDAGIEILNEEMIYSNNVIGMVEGTDPVLKNEYIVVSSHLDHVRPMRGEVCNGADDNASGSAGVIEMAEAVAMNPCKRSIIFVTFTAEEMGLFGSKYFLESKLFPAEQIKFNLNNDMIGRSDPKHEEDRAHYVRTSEKYLSELTRFITEVNKEITDFPLIFNDDAKSPGGSDHMTFIQAGIPGFFFFSGVYPDLHQPGDDAEKIDYPKMTQITQLGYAMVEKMGNMEVVPDFIGN